MIDLKSMMQNHFMIQNKTSIEYKFFLKKSILRESILKFFK